jgi:hypothetical protein
MHHLTLVLSMLACAFGGAGCSITTSSEPPVVTVPAGNGTLTLRWHFDGVDDPGVCRVCPAYGATTLELVIYDENGAQVTTVNAPCEGLSVSVVLPDGTYSADATLIDAAGNSRTLTKPLHAIVVVGGTDLAIDLDFPRGSFF